MLLHLKTHSFAAPILLIPTATSCSSEQGTEDCNQELLNGVSEDSGKGSHGPIVIDLEDGTYDDNGFEHINPDQIIY